MTSQPTEPIPPEPAKSEDRIGITLPLGGLTTAVSILLGLAAVVSLWGAFPFFDLADLMGIYQNRPWPPIMISAAETINDKIGNRLFIIFLVYVATATVFIIWQHRLATNAVALRGPLGLGPGWAIGSWFIPLANLVLPFLQLNQSARASDPDLYHDYEPRSNGTLPPVQIAWAGMFVAATLAFEGAVWYKPDTTGSSDISSTTGAFITADRIAGTAMLIYTVAGLLGIRMVLVLTRRQRLAIAYAS